jgi:hypothetical protein
VVGEDFAQEDIDFLASRKIISPPERVAGKTLGRRTPPRYERSRDPATDLNVFAISIPTARELPRGAYLFLGNIQPDLQRSVRSQMSNVQLTGGDTMNY